MRKLITLSLLLLSTLGFAADYYWVGGSGNWSDISHWAAVSGGTVKYPVAPTSEDNVIFDENSFTGPGQTVTFVNNIVFCKTMDWSRVTNNPTLAGSKEVSVSVFGDLLMNPDMNVSFEGKFILTGEAEDKVVDFAGQNMPGVLSFSGDSRWSILSNLMIDSTLEISRGTVSLNGNAVTCSYFHINSAGEKSIDIQNSTILVTGTYRDEFGYDGNASISMILEHGNLDMQAEGSRIELTAPNAEFRYFGISDLELHDLAFTAATGAVLLTSRYFEDPIEMNELTFVASARVEGTLNAARLNLGAGGRYRFGADRNYIFGEIIAQGDCIEGVVVTSDNPGIPAIFSVSGPTLDLNYITLRDIHGVGSVLNANDGVDLGNNDGWNFSNTNVVDYYWIGGSGMWDDPQHWSLTSGGAPAGCIPSGKDNAFFDENSFTAPNQSVRLNARSTYIHDMIWRNVVNQPEFTGLIDQRLVVTGSLELDGNMEHDIQGFYDFESSETGNTIRSNGNIFNESITFSGEDASWQVLDDVEIYRIVYFYSGQLTLDGNQLTTTRFSSYSERRRILDISSSLVVMRPSQYLGPEWTVDLRNYQVIADGSRIQFEDRSTFSHEGYSEDPMPRYNEVFFDNERAAITSRNTQTGEEIPATYINYARFAGRGFFSGSSEIGLLELADGFAYLFDSYLDRVQVIGDIITQGTCENGTTLLLGNVPGESAKIDLGQDKTLERMYIADIEILNATLTNNNSIDGGNNEGMTFNELVGRTLYWVGGEGVWQDPAHWSLSSGGPGGECIPTSLDDVYIDDNSFTLDAQRIETVPSQYAYCRHFIMTNHSRNPQIILDYLLVNGSLTVDNTFTNNITEVIFTSQNEENIQVNGQIFNNLRVRGSGEWNFEDDITFNNYIHNFGIVNFNDIEVACNAITTEGDQEKTIRLGNSRFYIGENNDYGFNDRGRNLTVEPAQSELVFSEDNAGIYSRSKISLNKVIFNNSEGNGAIASRVRWDVDDLDGEMSIAHLRFNGNGEVFGHLRSDTIIGVSGKVYTLDKDRYVNVSSYLQLRGNNCTPIELRSSANAEKAIIRMPSDGEVVVDFVQMKDIEATGGAEFNAGSRSVDVGGSNIGWLFEDAPDFIESGFLGEDKVICEGEPVELVAFSYSTNEEYQWSNGSMDSAIIVDQPGQYFVEVQFESNCVLEDTITIFPPTLVEPMLADTTSICASTSVTLSASVEAEDANYLWSDGSTEAEKVANAEGLYKVDVEVLGCTTSDSTWVLQVDNPLPILPSDTSLCGEQNLIIDDLLDADSYIWEDGTNEAERILSGEGLFWLEINKDNCDFRDTINIEVEQAPILNLGSDTSICEQTKLIITLDPSNTYQWTDGSTSYEYEVENAGTYAVEARNIVGCLSRDTIIITTRALPLIDLGEDIESCHEDQVVLSVPENYSEFVWEDGTDIPMRLISEEGSYSVTVTENDCSASDDIFVSFLELPAIDLGPADTVFCENEVLRIKPVVQSPGELTWQDLSDDDFFEATTAGKIIATVFNGECYNSDSIYVSQKECIFFDIYVPNAFSPNNDGYNDVFEIFFPEGLIINKFSIQIFDRWGNKVFATQDLDEKWDGKMDTKGLDSGVFIYYITLDYTDENGSNSTQLTGDIAIMR